MILLLSIAVVSVCSTTALKLYAAPLKTITPDLRVNNSDPLLYFFNYVPAGSISSSKQIRFSTQDLTSALTVTCPAGFEVSKNNINFFATIQYTASELSSDMICFVRFRPTEVNKGYGGSVAFSSAGIQVQRPDLSGTSLPPNLSLDVVNWNMEWFGGSLGPEDNDRQMYYAGVVMDSLGADIYILQEIVDTARLGAVTRALKNGPYDYVVAPYASNADNTSSGNWRSGQKLAYVYKRDMFSNISVKGFTALSNRTDNYYNWANGRYPYLFDSNVTVDGITKRVVFLSIHAKAELGDANDYLRRGGASSLMYDSLNFLYPTQHVLVAGDYNDDLDQTISSLYPGSPTPYKDFMNDPGRYNPLSFWNTLRGDNSYIGYPNVVDHCISSNEMKADYVPYSCLIRKDAADWVPYYEQDLSDHYPVQSRFNFRQSATNQITAVSQLVVVPDTQLFRMVFVNEKPISFLFDRSLTGTVSMEIWSDAGQLVWRQQRTGIAAGTMIPMPDIYFSAGVYRVFVRTGKGNQSISVFVR
jgi:hypothetical protein